MRVVVCSEIQWRYLRTRKQQILSRLPADWPILFLQAYVRGRPNAWRPVRDGRVTFVTVPMFKSIAAGPLRALQNLGAFRAVANLALWAWVTILRGATGFAGRDAALLVSNIYYGRIVPFLPRRATVYDCNDNHLAFPHTPAWARGYLARVVRAADAVVVSAPLLRDEVAPYGPRRVEEIGNGVDFELFDAAYRAPHVPAVLGALPRPVVGYAGALAAWIDLELLAEVARRLPGVSLALVGPIVDPAVRPEAAFAGLPNVHLLGPQPHDVLPHWIAGMDVCLVPFRRTPLTRGVNPNKLWEYFALGKPVVCSDFSPFVHGFAPHLEVASGAADFTAAVRRALAAPGDREARRALARARSWDASAARMAALLGELAGSPAAPPRL